jgi:hypothetical protein
MRFGARRPILRAELRGFWAMSTLEAETRTEEQRTGALLWWSMGLFGVLLALVGGLLWWRFGSLIFVDLLTTLQGCF